MRPHLEALGIGRESKGGRKATLNETEVRPISITDSTTLAVATHSDGKSWTTDKKLLYGLFELKRTRVQIPVFGSITPQPDLGVSTRCAQFTFAMRMGSVFLQAFAVESIQLDLYIYSSSL